MSCCGKNRQALKAARISVTAEPPLASGTRVTYSGTRSVLLRGPVTGRAYEFTPERSQQEIHPHDLAAILSTGLFTRQ